MRVIVAGSRVLCNPQTTFDAIDEAIAQGWDITEIVSGDAPGPDRHGVLWAKEHNTPFTVIPGVWGLGRKGGNVRNVNMAVYANTGVDQGGLILVWTGDEESSKGSAHMKKTGTAFKLRLLEKIITK